MKKVFSLSVLLFLCFLSCQSHAETIKVRFLHSNGTTSPEIAAEVAATRGARQLGLMYRKHLPEFQGMFFSFSKEIPRSFWMKNTYLELDIIFLDSKLQVINISARTTPLTETLRKSEKPAQYVLEIGSGLSEKWGIIQGSKMVVEGKVPEAID